jgi:MFS family permease
MALTSMIGTSIEFYDFFIFATAAAIVFPTVFFPKGISPLVALISSFSTFAIGFFARPVGGMVFGHFGDRLGRKRMLVLAMLLMGAATTLIGLLPPYQAIGDMAPLLLILLRLVQGFALGGQWGGAVLIIIEDAPPQRRGWYGAFAQVGAPAGTILANLMFLIVSAATSKEAFLSWGWRIPFLVSVLLIGVSLFVQIRLEETAAFATQTRIPPERRRSPLAHALTRYPGAILLAAGAFVGMQTSYYLAVSFSLAFGGDPHGGGMPTRTVLTAVLLGAMTMVPGVFIGAQLSDRIGRRVVVGVSAALLGLWCFAEFPLIAYGTLASAALALCVAQFLNGMIFGPLAALYAETFPIEIRYSGMSLGYQLGTLVGGALAPLIATALFAHYHSPLPISLYAAFMCAISVAAAWAMRGAATGAAHKTAS